MTQVKKPVKSFKNTHLGQTFKLGRNQPVAKRPRLKFSNYLTKAKLPQAPVSGDYSALAAKALSLIYLNDQLGCCVISWLAHAVGVLTGNANGGSPFIFTNQQIIDLYSAIGGYVPGDPSTDQGCNEQDALDYWKQHGAPAGSGHTIIGSMSVDPTNWAEVILANWLFENLMFGVSLPDSWLNVSGNGFVWDAATPDPSNGHCFGGVGWNSNNVGVQPAGIKVATWGMTGILTKAALLKDDIQSAGGELYTTLSLDAINQATQKCPAGVDWASMIADFNSISGGNIPVPGPPTPTPPAPIPPAPAGNVLFSFTASKNFPAGSEIKCPVAIPANTYNVVAAAGKAADHIEVT